MSATRRQEIRKNLDWVTLGLYFLLVLIGWTAIYSANFDPDHQAIFDFKADHGKQLIWMGICTFIALVLLNTEGEFFIRFSVISYVSVLVLLILVLIIGKKVGGARSWFGVGSFGIQPSEFAKTTTALMLAWFIAQTGPRFKALSTRIQAALVIGIPAGLILLQPDAGTVLVFAGLVFALYREGLSGNILIVGFGAIILAIVAILSGATTVEYPGFGEQSGIYVMLFVLVILGALIFFGVRSFTLPRYRRKNYRIVALSLAGALAFSFAVNFGIEEILQPHQRERIYVLFGMNENPDADYNIRHAKAAIGSGGWTGKGYLNGPMTRYKFVPEQHTDFIFCTIGEEWGFFGSMFVVALFIALILRVIHLAERQRSQFSRVYGYSVASILFMHLLINVGMVLGIAPVIGIPLPFFSYGGSSLMGFTILLMIMLRLDGERFSVFR
ncbi:MAG: rod shape-determining protein RodA [Flavobacteriales bacterium]|uniref:rod shape-determining protein RodA n=1 Tax=Sanyastnella coralliicola TaxID=3069118 RepID=UPI0027B9CE7A|nr:rod shape-determining protein RodA [Longitalea sp. SCSIO 12813]MCH2198468.1 rod shape-determining protein RodA [Flavobacteriales bacterium]